VPVEGVVGAGPHVRHACHARGKGPLFDFSGLAVLAKQSIDISQLVLLHERQGNPAILQQVRQLLDVPNNPGTLDPYPRTLQNVREHIDLLMGGGDLDNGSRAALTQLRQRITEELAAISGADYVVPFLSGQGVALGAKNDHGETALDLADAQERFRYGRAKEAAGNMDSKGTEIVRETQTSDAFKKLLGKGNSVASN